MKKIKVTKRQRKASADINPGSQRDRILRNKFSEEIDVGKQTYKGSTKHRIPFVRLNMAPRFIPSR